MVLRHALTFISLPLLAIPAVAAAQEAAVPPVESTSVVFPSMGADGSASQLGAQLMLMSGDGDSIKRIDVDGQFVSPSGMGGYASIGVSTVEDSTAFGAIEAGGLYRRTSGISDFTVRAGIILPTASGGDDGIEGFLNIISAAYSRPSDYLRGVPETTSLRVAFAPTMRSGNFIGRADLGLDLPIAGDGTELFESPFLHVDLGGGFSNHQGAVLVELSTMAYLEETDELLHLIALTGELHAGRTTPYVTISRPFESGDGDGFDITNIAVGVRGRL
ncbi:MAG: hypothetical protein F9K40_07290 [Kofleriaceae bacterium]|nr:MAG: hypothetical protein F9K40_07290 [Kofleriaceae bacterium]MBZ0234311.1 hypothetical protein [Kofleriaceae bacterium]